MNIFHKEASVRVLLHYVSDAFSIRNSLWFAEQGSELINLRHLSLIDVERSSFEMILDSLSPIDFLIMFSVHFVSADHPAVCTFVDQQLTMSLKKRISHDIPYKIP